MIKMPYNNEGKEPCDKCGSSKWVKWADGQNWTCQKCGNFYLKKPQKYVGKLGKI